MQSLGGIKPGKAKHGLDVSLWTQPALMGKGSNWKGEKLRFLSSLFLGIIFFRLIKCPIDQGPKIQGGRNNEPAPGRLGRLGKQKQVARCIPHFPSVQPMVGWWILSLHLEASTAFADVGVSVGRSYRPIVLMFTYSKGRSYPDSYLQYTRTHINLSGHFPREVWRFDHGTIEVFHHGTNSGCQQALEDETWTWFWMHTVHCHSVSQCQPLFCFLNDLS